MEVHKAELEVGGKNYTIYSVSVGDKTYTVYTCKGKIERIYVWTEKRYYPWSMEFSKVMREVKKYIPEIKYYKRAEAVGVW